LLERYNKSSQLTSASCLLFAEQKNSQLAPAIATGVTFLSHNSSQYEEK